VMPDLDARHVGQSAAARRLGVGCGTEGKCPADKPDRRETHGHRSTSHPTIAGVPLFQKELPYAAPPSFLGSRRCVSDRDLRDAASSKPTRPVTTDSQGGTKVAGQDEPGGPQQGQRGRSGGAGRGAQSSRNRTLHFEYDMATANVDLLDDDYKAAQRPRWASP